MMEPKWGGFRLHTHLVRLLLRRQARSGRRRQTMVSLALVAWSRAALPGRLLLGEVATPCRRWRTLPYR
jgi:hypothetical protein